MHKTQEVCLFQACKNEGGWIIKYQNMPKLSVSNALNTLKLIFHTETHKNDGGGPKLSKHTKTVRHKYTNDTTRVSPNSNAKILKAVGFKFTKNTNNFSPKCTKYTKTYSPNSHTNINMVMIFDT